MNSDNYKEYLKKMSKLHHYSFNNTVLILMQKPDASLVAGMTTFNKEFHRTVNKGEHGITILAPAPYKKTIEKPVFDEEGHPVIIENGEMLTEKKVIEIEAYKPVYVFDVSQTSGEPIPQFCVDELQGTVDNYAKLFEAVKSIAPVPVEFDTITNGAKGYYSHTEKKIVLNEGMSELQTLKTLIHETAHSILHDNEFLKSTGEKKPRDVREIEAESVAYAVASYFKLDTSEYSFGYIAGWSNRKIEAVKESLETIRKCTSDVITSVERELYPERLSLKAESQNEKQTKHKALSA